MLSQRLGLRTKKPSDASEVGAADRRMKKRPRRVHAVA